MATCIAFLRVPDIAHTINWYQGIGFQCTGTHQEPGCELDWAMIAWKGAAFMLYPGGRAAAQTKDAGLYLETESIDPMIQVLKERNADIIEINERTEYAKREIVIRDLNGFQVTFSCDARK
jgi:hypothetical protein